VTQLDRVEAKLNWLHWQSEWGSLYAPDGKYITLDPITLLPIGDVKSIPPKPEWPEDECEPSGS
jgi:hypothetical protein